MITTTTTMRVTFIFMFPCLFLEFALGGVGNDVARGVVGLDGSI
jgi:hypothetical protein